MQIECPVYLHRKPDCVKRKKEDQGYKYDVEKKRERGRERGEREREERGER